MVVFQKNGHQNFEYYILTFYYLPGVFSELIISGRFIYYLPFFLV
jgi:hypothetical protein